MSFIDSSNQWYLIASNPYQTINQIVLANSSNQYDASLAVVSLGNTGLAGSSSTNMTDISTSQITTDLSNWGYNVQGSGTPFKV